MATERRASSLLQWSKHVGIRPGCKTEDTSFSIGGACLHKVCAEVSSNDLGENDTFAWGAKADGTWQALVTAGVAHDGRVPPQLTVLCHALVSEREPPGIARVLSINPRTRALGRRRDGCRPAAGSQRGLGAAPSGTSGWR